MPANLFRTRRAPIPMDTSVQFRHTLPLQIRFNDVDTLGHVNNTVYFSFYDLGKSSYFQDVHPAEAVMRQTSVVLAHAEVDFLVPIRPEEHIARITALINKAAEAMAVALMERKRRMEARSRKIG